MQTILERAVRHNISKHIKCSKLVEMLPDLSPMVRGFIDPLGVLENLSTSCPDVHACPTARKKCTTLRIRSESSFHPAIQQSESSFHLNPSPKHISALILFLLNWLTRGTIPANPTRCRYLYSQCYCLCIVLVIQGNH